MGQVNPYDEIFSQVSGQKKQEASPYDQIYASVSTPKASPLQPQPVAPQPTGPKRSLADVPEPTFFDKLLMKLPDRIPDLPGAYGIASNLYNTGRGGDVGRVMMGAADPGVGAFQLGANITPAGPSVNKAIADTEAKYQAARTDGGGFDTNRLLGNVAITAPVAPARAASIPGQVAQAAGLGGAFGAAQPVTSGNYFDEKAKQVGYGIAGGVAAVPVSAGFARLVRPNTSPEVQRLIDEGMTGLTPGQALGGIAKRTEDKATSIPFLGDVIANAQRKTTEQLNTLAINRSLEPIGQKLPNNIKSGHEAISYAGEKLSQAYDNVLTKIGAVRPDQQLVADLSSLSNLTRNLKGDTVDQFNRVMSNEIGGRFKNGAMTSQELKAAESSLGSLARGYMRSPDYDVRKLGEAVMEAQNALRSWVQRASPANAPELQKINEGWANFVRVQRAASSVGAEGGEFTAAQLHNAVKAMDKSRNHGAFARGDALMQDLSGAAKATLPSKIPDSGTAGRAMVGLAGLGAGSGAAAATGYTPLALGALAALPYTTPGRYVSTALLARRPESFTPLAELIRSYGPAAGAFAAPGLLAAQ